KRRARVRVRRTIRRLQPPELRSNRASNRHAAHLTDTLRPAPCRGPPEARTTQVATPNHLPAVSNFLRARVSQILRLCLLWSLRHARSALASWWARAGGVVLSFAVAGATGVAGRLPGPVRLVLAGATAGPALVAGIPHSGSEHSIEGGSANPPLTRASYTSSCPPSVSPGTRLSAVSMSTSSPVASTGPPASSDPHSWRNAAVSSPSETRCTAPSERRPVVRNSYTLVQFFSAEDASALNLPLSLNRTVRPSEEMFSRSVPDLKSPAPPSPSKVAKVSIDSGLTPNLAAFPSSL